MPAVATVRRAVEHTKAIDRTWGDTQGVLLARVHALLGAQRAFASGEPDAGYALRQAAVDLSAAAETLAEALPEPDRARNLRGSAGWNVGT